MSDRNQEPSETAGPASGGDAATAEPAPAGGRVVNQQTGASSRRRGSRRAISGEPRASRFGSGRPERSGDPSTRPIG